MIANQIKVLIQQMRMRGLEPEKILLSHGLRWALREEMSGNGVYKKHDLGDTFAGLPVVVDNSVNQPLVMIKRKHKFQTGKQYLKELAKREGIKSTHDNQYAHH